MLSPFRRPCSLPTDVHNFKVFIKDIVRYRIVEEYGEYGFGIFRVVSWVGMYLCIY